MTKPPPEWCKHPNRAVSVDCCCRRRRFSSPRRSRRQDPSQDRIWSSTRTESYDAPTTGSSFCQKIRPPSTISQLFIHFPTISLLSGCLIRIYKKAQARMGVLMGQEELQLEQLQLELHTKIFSKKNYFFTDFYTKPSLLDQIFLSNHVNSKKLS